MEPMALLVAVVEEALGTWRKPAAEVVVVELVAVQALEALEAPVVVVRSACYFKMLLLPVLSILSS